MAISKIPKIVSELPKSLDKTIKSTSSIVQEGGAEKLTSALDCLAVNAIPSINRPVQGSNLPEFIYHLTSKENYEKILKDGKLKISSWEGNSINGCKGIYFVDKDNFLNNWLGRAEPGLFPDDIGKFLVMWVNKGSSEIIAIKIPTENLDKSKLRFRPFVEATYQAIDTFDDETGLLSSKMVKEGLPVSDLVKYKDTNEPIEYVYFGEITPQMFSNCSRTNFSENIEEVVRNLFK